MADYAQILEFIGKFSYIFTNSDYIQTQLKKKTSLKLISRIVEESNKKPGEVLVLFLSAVKYLWGNRQGNVFNVLEETDSFQEFVKSNQDEIIEMSVRKTLQANLPERALPLFEIFNKKWTASTPYKGIEIGKNDRDEEKFCSKNKLLQGINKKTKDSPIAVIDLGASYGMVGQCLLEPSRIIKKKNRYLLPGQKIPQNPRAVDYYLGIELDPPDKEWLFACLWKSEDELRIKNFINEIPRENEKFQLIEASAFGFSALEPVKRLTTQPLTVVVLTSFLFFQIGEEKQKKLKDEILMFVDSTGAHWINQTFKPSPSSRDKKSEYFIEWNGKKIIELHDDWCSDWRWVQ